MKTKVYKGILEDEALRLASHKLPIKTKFVKKESGENNEN